MVIPNDVSRSEAAIFVSFQRPPLFPHGAHDSRSLFSSEGHGVVPACMETSAIVSSPQSMFNLDFRARLTGQAHREPRRMVSIGTRREARQAG